MIVTCCQTTGYNVTFRFSTRQSSVNDLNIWHRKDNFAYSFRVLFHFLPHLAKITSREESIFIALVNVSAQTSGSLRDVPYLSRHNV